MLKGQAKPSEISNQKGWLLYLVYYLVSVASIVVDRGSRVFWLSKAYRLELTCSKQTTDLAQFYIVITVEGSPDLRYAY